MTRTEFLGLYLADNPSAPREQTDTDLSLGKNLPRVFETGILHQGSESN
jgi:hypothetical protein